MFSNMDDNKKLAKWIIGIAAVCILLYLGVRNINAVAGCLLWGVNIAAPLITGFVFAFVLNVPMAVIERKLFRGSRGRRKEKLRRPLAIILSLLLIFLIFVGVALLVIPEFINAIKIVIQNILQGIDRIAGMISGGELEQTRLEKLLESLEIDWNELERSIRTWASEIGEGLAITAVNTVGTAVSNVVDFFMGLVLAIYILMQKEKLKGQACRLICVWLPETFGRRLIYVAGVCSVTFRNFIVGQVTEAIILGTLCAAGMFLLRLPYAPMIGALVGVTALIPIVGALIGTVVGAFMILSVNPVQAVIFVVFLLALQQLEGNLIYPKVVGSKLNLPAIWVFAAVVVGGNLAGPLGMLIGVPAASAAYALLKTATEEREKREETC